MRCRARRRRSAERRDRDRRSSRSSWTESRRAWSERILGRRRRARGRRVAMVSRRIQCGRRESRRSSRCSSAASVLRQQDFPEARTTSWLTPRTRSSWSRTNLTGVAERHHELPDPVPARPAARPAPRASRGGSSPARSRSSHGGVAGPRLSLGFFACIHRHRPARDLGRIAWTRLRCARIGRGRASRFAIPLGIVAARSDAFEKDSGRSSMRCRRCRRSSTSFRCCCCSHPGGCGHHRVVRLRAARRHPTHEPRDPAGAEEDRRGGGGLRVDAAAAPGQGPTAAREDRRSCSA